MAETPSVPGGPRRGSMSLERLQTLLDAYGGGPDRWPADEREPALALLAGSSEARARRAAATRLDAVLDCVPAAEPSNTLLARVVAGAPGAPPRRRAVGWAVAAAVLPLAAAAAFVWLFPWSPPTEPSRYAITDLGVYTTPLDVLLIPPGLDVSGRAPTVGCEENRLGCPLEDVTVDRQSPSRPVRRPPA